MKKIVLNCCGPYQFYGEVVVKACIDAGTHHVDISGEPLYIAQMQLKYHDLAKQKKAFVVSTCAAESIPPEMGVLYADRHFDGITIQNFIRHFFDKYCFKGIINSAEMYFETSIDYEDKSNKTLLHRGTWESAIYAMKYGKQIMSVERKLDFENPLVKPKIFVKYAMFLIF